MAEKITVADAVQEYVGAFAEKLILNQLQKGRPIYDASTKQVLLPGGSVKPLTELTEEECGDSEYMKNLVRTAKKDI